jgi:type II secretion system protein H
MITRGRIRGILACGSTVPARRSEVACIQDSESKTRNGFTLLELIVVLTLLSIMLAAVVPVFSASATRSRHDQALRSLVATLRFAQERAIADGVEYRVYLDPDEDAYWVSRQVREEGTDEPRFAAAEEPYAQRRYLPEGIDLRRPKARMDRKADVRYIAFYPHGACDYAEVHMRNAARKRIVIRTKGAIGQFEVDGP